MVPQRPGEGGAGIIHRIRNAMGGAVVNTCSEMGCELSCGGLTEFVVLKGELVASDRRMCDCLVFVAARPIVIGVAELKSRVAHANEVMEKLCNGSTVAVNILRRYTQGHDYRLCHVVLSRRWNVPEYRVITGRWIFVGGKRYPVLAKRCGFSLRDAIAASVGSPSPSR